MMRFKRFATVFLFGFSAGMPLLLTSSTLQAWMVDEKIDLTMIGLFSLVGLPYTLKFLWAPLMDRYVPPFLGRRRGWMLIAQLGIIAAITAMAFSNPGSFPAAIAALAVCLSFFSASQDISIDACNTESLQRAEYGLGSALYTNGYRVAMLVSGAGALILADHLSWKQVYLIMAGVMIVGLLATLWAKEPDLPPGRPADLSQAIVLPFRDFFSRRGSLEVLAFLVLYRIDYNLTMAMTTPFVLQLGFTKTDIGVVTKGFGLAALIAGSLIGGAMIMRMGLKRALRIFGIAQAASGTAYLILARLGHVYAMMVVAITVENICGGMADAALVAFMMNLCNKRFTASQFALITSFMALSRYVAGAPSGFLAKNLGWEGYFLTCALAGIPALLLLFTRYARWEFPEQASL